MDKRNAVVWVVLTFTLLLAAADVIAEQNGWNGRTVSGCVRRGEWAHPLLVGPLAWLTGFLLGFWSAGK